MRGNTTRKILKNNNKQNYQKNKQPKTINKKRTIKNQKNKNMNTRKTQTQPQERKQKQQQKHPNTK